ncbi:hypothetical protein ACX12E_23200 [Paenibacillus vandeheii]|uniref:DUF1433 domain-containing protein n=1 Tax=Paenibacillus vandeheii TaxID=3035917 RepID=A0ABT8JIM5_9BACL|nr:hypothetical protein [Paenibacillus vandeheii]MDN4604905.1 hypothetical protein [Paenibacillus vandeheii]
MNNFNKKHLTLAFLFVWFSLTFIVLSGCMSSEQKDILQKAEKVSLTYFKENYGIDVEFTNHKFIPADLSHTVSLTGHVKGNKDQEVFAMVDYDTYEIRTGSVPDNIKPLK